MSSDWTSLVHAARERRNSPVRAETFLKKFATASQPVVLTCDDGHDYVVKSRHAGRMIVTDQIVGRVAHAAEAPVPIPALVEVPGELISAEPQMAHMTPGMAHGSRWVANCTDQKGFEHTGSAENRDRFARIALLYGWVVASDHQFIYETAPPHRVYSVDHGHFFLGSTAWTVDTLQQAAPAAEPDATVVTTCGLTTGELGSARAGMAVVADDEIALAVAYPPDAWNISPEERLALAEYLTLRRDVIFKPLDKENGK